MKTLDPEFVRQRIFVVAQNEMNLSEAEASEVAFHLTDWMDDLASYHQFCLNPDTLSNSEVNDLLLGFLFHVPNHLAAAFKLYTGMPVTDVFDVEATR